MSCNWFSTCFKTVHGPRSLTLTILIVCDFVRADVFYLFYNNYPRRNSVEIEWFLTVFQLSRLALVFASPSPYRSHVRFASTRLFVENQITYNVQLSLSSRCSALVGFGLKIKSKNIAI